MISNCKSENNTDKFLNEAKWLYYESNFLKNGVACYDNKIAIRDSNSNICFIEGLSIKRKQIGDTIEFTITAIKDSNFYCICNEGVTLNIFGFLPNTDTVAYRSSESFTYKKLPDNNYNYSDSEWTGIYSRAYQKIKFKDFIKKNYCKLNNFLKTQSKERKYI